MDRIGVIKVEQRIIETLSDEEQEIIRCACNSERDLAIIDLLSGSGMRVSELSGLNIRDVNFETGEIKVFSYLVVVDEIDEGSETVDEEGNTQYYVPADTVVMLPEGQIGTTWYGTTPEEADLLGSKEADVFIVDTGVAITVTKETDPVRKVTKVSEICLPSAENIDKVLIIDALGA